MASLFDIDYSQQARDLMPPDKRKPGILSAVLALISPVQWLRDLTMGTYKSGATAPVWANGTYNKYDQVIFNKAVYMSLVSGNTTAPTDSTKWKLIANNFIGVDERIKFNCQVIVLEYALNKRFGGTFRTPPSASHSDIYLSNLPAQLYGFLVGQTKGSTVGKTNSSDSIGSPYPFRRVNGYQINFLASLYALTNETEVRDYVDQYNAEGMRYTVVEY